MKSQLFLTILKGVNSDESYPILAVSDQPTVQACLEQITRSLRDPEVSPTDAREVVQS